MTTHWRIGVWLWRFGFCRHLHVHVRGLRRSKVRCRQKDAQIEAALMLVLLIIAGFALCLL